MRQTPPENVDEHRVSRHHRVVSHPPEPVVLEVGQTGGGTLLRNHKHREVKRLRLEAELCMAAGWAVKEKASEVVCHTISLQDCTMISARLTEAAGGDREAEGAQQPGKASPDLARMNSQAPELLSCMCCASFSNTQTRMRKAHTHARFQEIYAHLVSPG